MNETEESDFTHRVFRNDPTYLLSLVDQYAVVQTKYSTQVCGFITSIDPVTESVIMDVKENNKTKTRIIMGHCIIGITVQQPPPGCEPRIKRNIQELDPEYTMQRKNAILNWFAVNLLPVEDKDGVLQVHGEHLCIVPPYTPDDCISNNSIILGRIQHLLHNMPTATDTTCAQN